MHLDQFNYHLPEGLIAKHPPQNRTDARLLLFINEVIKHKQISALNSVITKNDILEHMGGWGVRVKFSSYRNRLRNEKDIKLTKDRYEVIEK